MSTMGIILSTVGDTQYCGDIMMHVGVFSTVGKNLLLFEYPTVLNTPHGTHDTPTCIMVSPHGTQISKDGIPHGTHDIPTCIMNPPRY